MTSFFDKKVLVTGAGGFIGSHLCQRLHEMGAEVHGISRKIKTADDNKIHWWRGDLADLAKVRRILAAIKPDFIYHLASHVSGSRDLNIVLPTFHSNLTTTVNLLTIATQLESQRIVLAGSLEESEPGDGDALVPCSPYAAAKLASTDYARMFYALYQTSVTIARLFMVYGPGQQDHSKLIPYAVLSLLRGEPPRISSGQRPVDWIYVEDVIDGLISIATTPNLEGGTIDLGSGKLVLIRDVVEQLVRLVGSRVEPLFGALKDRPMEQVRVANIADTYEKIGWQPKTELAEGLRPTIEWYRNSLSK